MGQGASTDAYEGLVIRTAQMFYERVGLELDDMRQELRIKVLKAVRSYKPGRSRMTERAWVYACLANLVKDLKRDAARRKERMPLGIAYIEGFGHTDVGRNFDERAVAVNQFEYRFMHASHADVYGPVDNRFTMPATITLEEQEVIYLLVLGYDQTEIALQLGVERWAVVKWIAQIREKLADWRPGREEIPEEVIPPQRQAVAA